MSSSDAAGYNTQAFQGVVAGAGSAALALMLAAVVVSPPRPSARSQPMGEESALAASPFSVVAFRDLRCTLSSGRVLLHGLSGALRRSELVALLGPSGGGKTTLLSLLAGQPPARGVRTDGVVTLDGAPAPPALRRAAFGFVAQEDALPGYLTAWEAVHFHASLRAPASGHRRSGAQAAAAAEEALAELSLTKVQHSLVRLLSGGERRRAAIAAELAVGPAALLLDEPTGGLDACHALSLVRALRALAQAGRPVLCSLHTPSLESFALFDQALLLADGRLLWRGGVRGGGEAGAESFFAQQRCERPPGRSVPEHLLFVAVELSARGEWVECEAEAEAEAEAGEAAPLRLPGAPPAMAQLRALMLREMLRMRRQPALLASHAGLALGLALWLGGVYCRLDDTITGFQNRLGLIFFILASFSFSGLGAAGGLLAESATLRAEAHRCYHPLSFVAAKLASDFLLLRIAPAAVHACVLYRMVGLQAGARHFGVFVAVVSLHATGAAALSFLIAAATSSVAVCTLFTSFVLLQQTVFGGLLTSSARLPAWCAWLRYTSLSFFSFEAAVGNELQGLVFDLGINGIDGILFSGGDLLSSALALQPQPGADLLCELVWVACAAAATALLVTLAHAPRGA